MPFWFKGSFCLWNPSLTPQGVEKQPVSHTVCIADCVATAIQAWEAMRCEPLSWLSCRLSSAFLPPPSHFDFLHFCPKPSLRMSQLQFQSSHQPSLLLFPERHLQTDVQVYPWHSATAFGEVCFLTKNVQRELNRRWGSQDLGLT